MVDEKMRAKHAGRRSAERKLGLSPLEAYQSEDAAFRAARDAAETAKQEGNDPSTAFWSTLREKHPTPDQVSYNAFANWTPETVRAKLEEIIGKKDVMPMGGPYSALWFAIFTDEDTIDRHMIESVRNTLSSSPIHINRVFLMTSYDPESQNYPMAQILG